MNAACRPASITVAAARSATTVLPEPDVAVKEPQHAIGLRKISNNVVDCALLRQRERIGQGGDDAGAQESLGGAAAAGARAHVAAQQRERELAGEQFVVGEPRPRRNWRLKIGRARWMMHSPQRLGEAWKAVALEPRGILPLGQIGQAMERNLDCLAQLVWMQPLGEGIDRIDQRQLGKAGCIHHTVGMHHLQMAIVERRDAGNVAGLAFGKELLQIIPARIEIGDGQRVGVVAGIDVVGRAGPVRRRRPVAIDGDGDGDNGIGRDGGKLWLIAPVDEAGRQMKQEIDEARRLVVAARSGGRTASPASARYRAAPRAARTAD